MADGLERFGVRDLLTEIIIPELRQKADTSDLKDLENDVRQLQTRILSPESVASMIGVALEKKEARGWTGKERVFAVITLALLCVSTITGLALALQAFYG